MPKKKHPHGHYCKICGQYKANEKFSGKGHAAHICKACSRLPAAEKAEAMTMNKLLGLSMRKLNESERKWLENRTHDKNPEVAGLAQEIYRQRFPYAERNAMKKQLIIDKLMFEIHREAWSGHGVYETINQRYMVSRKERTITLHDFDKEEPERTVSLDSKRMSKLLKWIVHTQEIFMWPQDYGLYDTGDALPDMIPEILPNDYDAEGWFEAEEVQDSGTKHQEDTWKVKIRYTNGTEQKIYDGGYGLLEKAEELYFALVEYFEPEEAEWE